MNSIQMMKTPSFQPAQASAKGFACGMPDVEFRGRVQADSVKFGTNYDQYHEDERQRKSPLNFLAAMFLGALTLFGIQQAFQNRDDEDARRDMETQLLLQQTPVMSAPQPKAAPKVDAPKAPVANPNPADAKDANK